MASKELNAINNCLRAWSRREREKTSVTLCSLCELTMERETRQGYPRPGRRWGACSLCPVVEILGEQCVEITREYRKGYDLNCTPAIIALLFMREFQKEQDAKE